MIHARKRGVPAALSHNGQGQLWGAAAETAEGRQRWTDVSQEADAGGRRQGRQERHRAGRQERRAEAQAQEEEVGRILLWGMSVLLMRLLSCVVGYVHSNAGSMLGDAYIFTDNLLFIFLQPLKNQL